MPVTIDPPRRRSRWTLYAVPIVVLILAAAWSAFWFYASSRIESELDGWRAREAKSGRIYDCTNRSVAGFPFRLELHCNGASVALVSQTAEQAASGTPMTVRLADIFVIAQVYDPQHIIAEFTGPVSFTDIGQQPSFVGNWSKGRASVIGLPFSPQRTSFEFDAPALDRMVDDRPVPLLRANHAEFHARLADGSVADNPVIETVLQVQGASLQGVHAVLQVPFNADIRATLRGLKDLSPKPWPVRFREIQAAGGRIDITQSRVEQGEVLSLAAGSLGINANGKLDGQLEMTIAGLDKIIPALGLDRLIDQGVSQSAIDKMAPGVSARDVNNVIGALDRMIPGLGNLARKNANAGLAAGINMLGQPTTLEGRKAIALPLKFVDGAIFLGPLQVAQTPPLF
ncbi:DUF2125 domain-containing protein [Bradyrhizobium sp. U87765 SZCCT0131]|uniref:DUF2125 domain-containing protein n=1 Tax=unclassified Bradyrhizobium TaxID=2631580 RepID=UPI001BAC101B|nr:MULTISPECIES: DUF2125 domain-containing protein [unclassified Bradyrhizobium]MBR1220713.1 DUF2125 domain-containing protein [Bradyrhizobium sp. U87765 SZCCT0131]MBR1260467.1 DUF2125 domain-containing protein [Bradyrhizobium sp. U87765 SZCCT0134]MBR1307284.1 DUF2125 domain-containing protein [Bradyrhizobium sp. U87765 SZCCT0110]MBR1321238.1 DUF2125 domain-containing protein [Bradyrhizobium sp. U87765 SZCCT0109]MBR1349551.1 DUF2125 domain-containing protein [Bradyrhizobium sp. U87765 SZCCT004